MISSGDGARLYKEFTDEGDWFLNRGIKDVVTDPQTGKTYDLSPTRAGKTAGNRPELLGHAPRGTRFKDLPDNWSMLDPIKVSILAPVWATMANWKLSGTCCAGHSMAWPPRGIVPTKSPTSDYVPVLAQVTSREMGNADQHAVFLQTHMTCEYAAGAGDAGTGAGLS